MWDEDIPSFIQALTSLDEGSFISTSFSSSSTDSTTKASQFYCENKDQDCGSEHYEAGESSPDVVSGKFEMLVN